MVITITILKNIWPRKISKKLNASENGEIRFNKQQNGKSNELFQILKITSKMADAD